MMRYYTRAVAEKAKRIMDCPSIGEYAGKQIEKLTSWYGYICFTFTDGTYLVMCANRLGHDRTIIFDRCPDPGTMLNLGMITEEEEYVERRASYRGDKYLIEFDNYDFGG